MIRKLLSPIYQFLQDSRAVGIILIICTALSLILANSAWQQAYLACWDTVVHIPVPALHLPHTVLHWINDGLMVPFFFLVGMEIKREVTIGELSSIGQSLLPVFAALGGMICPALIFSLFNGHTPYTNGWGIPMATDIAFSLGILSLLGNRVPLSLKIFLTALAIIDDLGAIITIAIFYTAGLQLGYLLAAAAILILLIILNRTKVRPLWCYFIPGILLWYCIYNSGIHATIAGVLLATCIPLPKISRLIHQLHDPVNFVIMPIFALSNTAIIFPADIWQSLNTSISYGILAGLIIGKPLGICLFSFVATRLRLATLPDGAHWGQMLGIGMIAGIGFTMSIFIATLAYTAADWQITSKIAIIAASLLSGLIGYIFLKRAV
ncbi:Na+:H+ antiporter, NhaA family [Chitinophaga sp. YR627]|uniref:Na+/H+ antiporter NhaA n=1 Tax=Chitinophaga sp. YR627 TaxID=1881041 RepID=UPI0008E6EF8A|nr:Na+/H+ antiporter NhaA [Chitinophaga sp. YR627]SFO55900.1 Na+:H+ antiporter, NhaA family [Chitinophaga sp. YR627]